MDFSTLLIVLLGAPLVATLIMAILPSKYTSRSIYVFIHILAFLSVLVLGLYLAANVFLGNEIFALSNWLHIDALSAIFVALIAVIASATGLHAIGYIGGDAKAGKLDNAKVKLFYTLFSLFMFTMLLAVLSNNIVMTWISVEATTLSTVFLVGLYRDKLSLEAAWKYIIVCTVGVAFGLYSTVLVYSNAVNVLADPHEAAFWTSIIPHASQFDPQLMRIAFVFAVIGFGTKAGIFPMSTWLPDAHSEAPASVSALLSSVLLKCAVFVIIRYYSFVIPSTGDAFPQTILLVLGGLSIVVSAFTIYTQHDLKRKLAYHSVENIGIIVFCLGIGGSIGIMAALLHCVAHGFTKALLFCISGDLQHIYKTRDTAKITGILRIAPLTAVMFALGLFALSGLPPFAMFISETTMFFAGVDAGLIWLIVIVAIALTVVMAAIFQLAIKGIFNAPPEGTKKERPPITSLAAELALLAVVAGFIVALPGMGYNGFQSATYEALPDQALSEQSLAGQQSEQSLNGRQQTEQTLTNQQQDSALGKIFVLDNSNE
ncbi:MAG: hydrogenase 4 subunit F [Coriobacteriales bacterium]|jgi:hydrogenase-4 component F|nr:hydrogenase 4 subunit F [Coriobacteriales bacterium]